MPAEWIASEATKKWLWSLTTSFRASSEERVEVTAKKILTFIDCLPTHANNVFTADDPLLFPIINFLLLLRLRSIKFDLIEKERDEERENEGLWERRKEGDNVLSVEVDYV